MANKQLVFQNAVRDLSTGQFFDLIFIDGGTSYTVYLRDNPQPPSQPADVAQITIVGATPVIAPSGGGDVVGTGTTDKLMKWVNGPASIAGDSLCTESAGGIAMAAGKFIQAPTSNFGPQFGGFQLGTDNTGISQSPAGTNTVTRILHAGADAVLVQRVIASGKTDVFIEGASGEEAGIILSTTGGTQRCRIFVTPATGAGVLLLTSTAAGTTFSRLIFGAALVGNPSLKVSGAGLICRLGDDSADAAFQASALTVSGLTANAFLFSGVGGLLTATAAPTNGQLLIGSTGAAPVAAGLTAGNSIAVTNGAGSITIRQAATVVGNFTTPVTLTTDSAGIYQTNEGAGAQIVFNLPAAANGVGPFSFIVQDADGIQVTAQAGDTIRLGAAVSSAGGTATSVTIGSVITLVAINATEWIATSIVGVWVMA